MNTEKVEMNCVYTRKNSPFSSHEIILKQIEKVGSVLDLGSSNGILYNELKEKGHQVTCVDMSPPEAVAIPLEDYIECNLEEYHKLNFNKKFDYIVLADVIEHLRNAQDLLLYIQKFLKDDGLIIISVPNIAIFLYRVSLMLGRFDYTQKGTLDETHVRFYTKSTFMKLLNNTSYQIQSFIPTGLPFEVFFGKNIITSTLDFIYYIFASIWHKMFAYQFVIVAKRN